MEFKKFKTNVWIYNGLRTLFRENTIVLYSLYFLYFRILNKHKTTRNLVTIFNVTSKKT